MAVVIGAAATDNTSAALHCSNYNTRVVLIIVVVVVVVTVVEVVVFGNSSNSSSSISSNNCHKPYTPTVCGHQLLKYKGVKSSRGSINQH